MKKYRLLKKAGYYHWYKVQKFTLGFWWRTVYQGQEQQCRSYIRDTLNPIVEEF